MWTRKLNGNQPINRLAAVISSPVVIESISRQTQEDRRLNADHGQCKIVPLDRILTDPNNPRRVLRDIDALSASMSAIGIIEPLIVTPCPAMSPDGDIGEFFQILSGHRRYEAAKRLGQINIEVIVRTLDEDDSAGLLRTLTANIQREALGPIELAEALHRVLNCAPGKVIRQQLVQALGRDKAWISRCMRVLDLPKPLREKVATSQLLISHDALASIARLDDPTLQEKLVDSLLAGASNQDVQREIRRSRPKAEPCSTRRVFVTEDSMSVIVECKRSSGSLTISRVMNALEKALKRVSAMMIVVAAVLAFGWSAHRLDAACPHYSMDIIAGPSCGGSSHAAVTGLSLNNLGDCCGYMSCPGGYDKAVFSFNAGLPTFVPLPAGTIESWATAINDSQVVAGWYMNTNMPGYGDLGFVWDGTTLITIFPPAGGTWADVYDLNSSGVAVGAWAIPCCTRAFRWENGVLQDISKDMPLSGSSLANALSVNGLITGYMGDTTYPPNRHAFIWNNGKVTDLGFGNLPGCLATEGRSVNSKGQVAGIWWKATAIYPYFVVHGFFWDGKQLIDLGTWSEVVNAVFPMDIDENGNIVGALAINNAFVGGFLWHDGVLQNLYFLATPAIVAINAAYSINIAGQILAHGSLYAPLSGQVAARLTPIPAMLGDATCDLQVNVDDILAVINQWGLCVPAQPCYSDLNNDFFVNQLDLLIVFENWKAL